ncbi:MAG: hypothetical protein K0U29_07835 [Gammaproteobacteria bacterium]|nr:hypothetical protein [Gammaproteobacteria bacterium]
MGLGNWLVKKIGGKLTRDKHNPRSYLCDFDRVCHEVRIADVLLIEGRNKLSAIIQKVSQSPWSHSALYIGRLHDIEDQQLRETIQKHYQGPPRDQLLIESVIGKGTVISSINNYKNDHIRICRPHDISHQDAQRVIANASKSLGTEYNIRHFIDLGRFLLKSKFIPSSFYSSLFRYSPNNKSTQDICSAMIANAFTSIKFPILPHVRENENEKLEFIHRNPKLFAPCDFDYSPYFNIIKYPILPKSQHAPYRNLPWQDNLISNDDQGIIKTDE